MYPSLINQGLIWIIFLQRIIIDFEKGMLLDQLPKTSIEKIPHFSSSAFMLALMKTSIFNHIYKQLWCKISYNLVWNWLRAPSNKIVIYKRGKWYELFFKNPKLPLAEAKCSVLSSQIAFVFSVECLCSWFWSSSIHCWLSHETTE